MSFKCVLFLGVACLCLAMTKGLQAEIHSEGRSYIIPAEQAGVRQTAVSLDGEWLFRFSPQSGWAKIQVPGEAAMQGYAIGHDEPFVYRRSFTVPADYAGKCVVLRFDGVYSHARLRVNGKPVREHHGGFTRWETDVTPWVKPGKKNEVELEVTDRLDDISYASGYAHHPVGGILRGVTLFALPRTHLYDAGVETHLDSVYRNAVLQFSCMPVLNGEAEVVFSLADAEGNPVKLEQSRFALKDRPERQSFRLPVQNPLKWDAEHPNLYTLETVIRQGGKELCRMTRKVGFREVRIAGNRMLVNGQPVKLRGACRHDIHPELGRTTTAGLDSLDAVLFKQANMNFVRTSHYPPSEKFLEFCDRYGLYVECETAVCFVNTYRQKNYAPGASQDDPLFTGRYLGQCQEMVKSFRSHPAILFWSLGNESAYGKNFQVCHDWVKSADSTRPVIFSYPGSVDQGRKMYDILSMHYQDVRGNVSQWGMSARGFQGHGIPALFDEWAHPACYTYATLQTDPNIREFWGQSLDMMWNGLFDAPGGLGGAIWGYIDETFALPVPKAGTAYWKEFARTAKPADYQGNCVGYGEWGIVDVWRRQKPEFWATKKAYSPIRILADRITDFTPGQRLLLTVYNRYDHTSLNEVSATVTYKGRKKALALPALPPHQKGILFIEGEDWEDGEALTIEFFTAQGGLVDACRLPLGNEKVDFPPRREAGSLSVVESEGFVTVTGKGFEIPFEKATGLIRHAKADGKVLIENGPFLNIYVNLNHLTGAEVRKAANFFTTAEKDWTKESFSYREEADGVYVSLSGRYGEVKADFHIKVGRDGVLDIDYTTQGVPNGYLREEGLCFQLAQDVQQVEWKRKGYWNYYPAGAFAGNEGAAALYSARQAGYGERPAQPWQEDTRNYFYWADAGADCRHPLTQAAKGMKENVYYYTLSTGQQGHSLSVVSPGASVACRINKRADESLVLYANNRWDYPEIAWGNYCKTLEALPCFGKVRLQLR